MRVALLYGGASPEHAISCRSAKTMYQECRKEGHTVIPIGISLDGRWSIQQLDPNNLPLELPTAFIESSEVSLIPSRGLFVNGEQLKIDVCFPVTHGTQGEDGMIQSLCELAHLPYVGSNVVTSALCMDKFYTKTIIRSEHIATLDARCITYSEYSDTDFVSDFAHGVLQSLGKDLIFKPNDGGSSIGIEVVINATKESIIKACKRVFAYSDTVLVEPYIHNAVELECALIFKDGILEASLPGLIEKSQQKEFLFLDYEQKYDLQHAATIIAPAPLSSDVAHELMFMAREIGNILRIDTYARCDFLYDPQTQQLYFNEINTIPGLTAQSHYPTLAQQLKLNWSKLIHLWLTQAKDRFKQQQRINQSLV